MYCYKQLRLESDDRNICQMDLVHLTNTHSADFRHYGLDWNRNYQPPSSQHNTYWQWQHSDGSSSDGFHQQSVFNSNQWDASSPPQPEHSFGDLQSSTFRPKSGSEWNHPYFRYILYQFL